MLPHDVKQKTPRRKFLGSLATGAAALSLATLISPGAIEAAPATDLPGEGDAEKWFDKIKGKHRMVFDATKPHEILPFAWPKVFLITNEKTGTPQNNCSVVLVLRHNAIPYALADNLWVKYKFGEVFKIDDPVTKAPSVRNPFWKPKPGDFKVPGIGEVAIGINELQESGVMICVCDMAITVNSAVIAQEMSQDAEAVKKEFIAGILPGIQLVPSGVWAIGRAQEHGCTYCFAG